MKPLWQPDQARQKASRMANFWQQAEQSSGCAFEDYQALWSWSNKAPQAFWSLVWDFCGVVGTKGEVVVNDLEKMPGASWFPQAQLNYAENLLAHADNKAQQDAIVFWGEAQSQRRLSYAELSAAVSRCQQALQKAGIKAGDRVVGYLPNTPEAVIAMLATTSLGAVWCSASPDFGVDGALDRFGQISPKAMFCSDGYFYNGKWIDCRDKNQAICKKLSCLTIEIPYHGTAQNESGKSPPSIIPWHQWLAAYPAQRVFFQPLSFSHPLFILFSSGTTGAPKCIVHSVGGTLIQHVKEHQLHGDIRADDKLFYFTTLGWMMWNWLVSGLASGASLVLYDGSPFALNKHGKPELLFDLAEAEQISQFGTSAKFLEAANKQGLLPKHSHDLSALRSIFSTGSPLAPEGFRYVYENIKEDVLLASISGGTDIISCFVLGNPMLPVWSGELQCAGLGMAVDVFDASGESMTTGKGDLVCTQAFPSMPIGFWNDETGERYRAAYFDRFDQIWCHGDYVELTEHGGMIIHGRSDAVLNPGGVRIGTAEIYRQVEKINEVLESVVIGQQWQDDVRVVLFVVLKAGLILDDALMDKIKTQIRSKTTPRHVPALIRQVEDIPRTKSGKIVELAVRDTVHGLPVKNKTSLANPQALDLFKDILKPKARVSLN